MMYLPRCAAIAAITLFAGLDAHADWPTWRGPHGTGVAASPAPTSWSDTENIKWVVDIPGRGFSTPIVIGDRLFLTTAIPVEAAPADIHEQPDGIAQLALEQDRGGGRGQDRGRGGENRAPAAHSPQRFEVMCLDRNTGETLWTRTAVTAVPHEGFHRTYGSWASYAPISDGERLIVSFGSFGMYCYDLDGNLQWTFDPGVKLATRNQFGEGCAPALWEDTIVHVLDQEGQSQIIAINANNGEEIWRRDRDEPTTWAQPLVTRVGERVEVITSGTNMVRSYDLETGDVIWSCSGLGLNAIPNPLRHEDTVLVMTGYRDPNLMCIELGRVGDLSGTDAVRWSVQQGTSYTCSPVLVDGLYYALTDRGEFSCFDPVSGEPHYLRERLPRGTQCKASPIEADGKLYIADESGRVHIVRAGPAFEVIATNELTDAFFVASPIVVDGDLYLRSRDRMYCIAESPDRDVD